MLKQLPIAPETFAADTTYTSGCLRKHEDDMCITAHIRFHPNQARNMVAKCGFDYVCLEGKVLPKSAFLKKDRTYQYVARQHERQRCPVKAECLPPGQKRRYVALSIFHLLHLEAKKRNEGETFEVEMLRRQTRAGGCSRRRTAWAGLEAG